MYNQGSVFLDGTSYVTNMTQPVINIINDPQQGIVDE